MKIYHNITKAKFEAICRAAGGYGIKIEGDQGSATAFGVAVKWDFQPEAKWLRIEVTNSGLLSPDEALNFIDSIVQTA